MKERANTRCRESKKYRKVKYKYTEKKELRRRTRKGESNKKGNKNTRSNGGSK
jgi:hypothetical protein